ncbi:MAG: FAD-dependent oxidoreductase, partial [Anaerolineales bacterium]|nr:FAD-dependent oxidoreductase [Anaerolineales bacterium]
AEKYLIPYNRKIWKRDLKELSLLWVDRIPDPSREEIVKSALGIETEGYTHQLNFYYPRSGGIEGMIHGLLKQLPPVQTGFRVKNIIKIDEGWEITDGDRSILGKRIISTIPIFDLINSLENVPNEVLDALKGLQYNSVIVVMIGVNHEGLKGRTALYIPDPDILAHRVCYLKEFSAGNAPEGKSHLIAEITIPPSDPLLKIDDDKLVARVVSDLKDICGFSKDDIISSDVKRMEYAYVVYDLDYEKNTGIIYDYLNRLGIQYAGRFGSFKYINMDTTVKMVKDLVASLQ